MRTTCHRGGSPRRFPLPYLLAGVLIGLALPGPAAAAGRDQDTLHFRLQPGPDSVLGLAGASPTQAGVMHSGLGFFGEHALDLAGPDGQVVPDAIQDRVVGDIALGIGFGKGAGIYTSIPVVVHQTGWSPLTGDALPREAQGDLRMGGHFVLLDPEKHHVGISLQPGVQIPTGSMEGYFSSGMMVALAEAGLEVRVGPLRVLGSAGGEIGITGGDGGVVALPVVTYGVGVEVRPVPEWSIAAAYTGKVLSFDDWEIPMEVRVGTAVHPEARLSLGGFCGWGVVPGPGTPEIRAGGQFTIAIRSKPRPEPDTLVGLIRAARQREKTAEQATTPSTDGSSEVDRPQ